MGFEDFIKHIKESISKINEDEDIYHVYKKEGPNQITKDSQDVLQVQFYNSRNYAEKLKQFLLSKGFTDKSQKYGRDYAKTISTYYKIPRVGDREEYLKAQIEKLTGEKEFFDAEQSGENTRARWTIGRVTIG